MNDLLQLPRLASLSQKLANSTDFRSFDEMHLPTVTFDRPAEKSSAKRLDSSARAARRHVAPPGRNERYHGSMLTMNNVPLNSSHPADVSRAEKFCILGAGSSGLAVAKNFRQAGIPFDCLEREDDVGGNWYYGRPASSVYRSTRLISSKSLTEYTDFPMPDHYPDHPDQDMVWRYLRKYAEHFDLYPQIEFGASVNTIEPPTDGADGWKVELATGEKRRYSGVIIANGHNWDPRWPDYPGKFDGQVLHSSQYKTPDVLSGRRVLVVGGGNSGFDIASESARHAAVTFHSLRRGYPLLPRFFRGRPVDQGGEWMLSWKFPLWLRRLAIQRVSRLAWQGKPPAADHSIFETHPAINGRWPLDVERGAITLKPDIAQLAGHEVQFRDGTREHFDVVIYATGYKISFPFLDASVFEWRGGRPRLFLNMCHPERDDLFVAGLIQPDSGQFGLVDYQAQLMAAYLRGLKSKQTSALRFKSVKQRNRNGERHGIRYAASPRHLLEVEHFGYRRELIRWIKRLG